MKKGEKLKSFSAWKCFVSDEAIDRKLYEGYMSVLLDVKEISVVISKQCITNYVQHVIESFFNNDSARFSESTFRRQLEHFIPKLYIAVTVDEHIVYASNLTSIHDKIIKHLLVQFKDSILREQEGKSQFCQIIPPKKNVDESIRRFTDSNTISSSVDNKEELSDCIDQAEHTASVKHCFRKSQRLLTPDVHTRTLAAQQPLDYKDSTSDKVKIKQVLDFPEWSVQFSIYYPKSVVGLHLVSHDQMFLSHRDEVLDSNYMTPSEIHALKYSGCSLQPIQLNYVFEMPFRFNFENNELPSDADGPYHLPTYCMAKATIPMLISSNYRSYLGSFPPLACSFKLFRQPSSYIFLIHPSSKNLLQMQQLTLSFANGQFKKSGGPLPFKSTVSDLNNTDHIEDFQKSFARLNVCYQILMYWGLKLFKSLRIVFMWEDPFKASIFVFYVLLWYSLSTIRIFPTIATSPTSCFLSFLIFSLFLYYISSDLNVITCWRTVELYICSLEAFYNLEKQPTEAIPEKRIESAEALAKTSIEAERYEELQKNIDSFLNLCGGKEWTKLRESLFTDNTPQNDEKILDNKKKHVSDSIQHIMDTSFADASRVEVIAHEFAYNGLPSELRCIVDALYSLAYICLPYLILLHWLLIGRYSGGESVAISSEQAIQLFMMTRTLNDFSRKPFEYKKFPNYKSIDFFFVVLSSPLYRMTTIVLLGAISLIQVFFVPCLYKYFLFFLLFLLNVIIITNLPYVNIIKRILRAVFEWVLL